MTDNYQIIPLDLPEHLALFLAHKLSSYPSEENNQNVISVDRYSFFGDFILAAVAVSDIPLKNTSATYALKVSNFAANNVAGTPNWYRKFVFIPDAFLKRMQILLKDDFKESLIEYVQGAEFGNHYNGFNPEYKKRGIRKAAIFNFLEERGLATNKRELNKFYKMYQRHLKDTSKNSQKTIKKMVQTLSY